MIVFLIEAMFCGVCGAYVAHRAGLSRVAGAVIGGLFNVLGVIFLLAVWGAENVESFLERPEPK